MCVIYVVEEHQQVLTLWQEQEAHSLHVLHLDAHCDMRGLLIDRQAQLAYRIWDKNRQVDQGNYLTHAILEGRISNLRWVYNEQGGRQNDVGTVKYESDLSAVLYRGFLRLQRNHGIPINFEDVPYNAWMGLYDVEILDIDWDFFAGFGNPQGTIQANVDPFLKREFHSVPAQVYVCYSPDFSYPSREQFHDFIASLARIFTAEVVELHLGGDTPIIKSMNQIYARQPLFRLARRIYYSASLGLRKRGIY
jgi:UPF0489 domain